MSAKKDKLDSRFRGNDGVEGAITPSDSWKVTLPCTRAEAEALQEDVAALAMLDPMPTLTTAEPDPARPDDWQLEAYFEGKPKAAAVKLLQSLLPSSVGAKPVMEKLPDEDWVTLSQAGVDPVSAGRFHVIHQPDEPIPAGRTGLIIPAGRAFGTGTHETTAGCLEMLDRMKRLGERFDTIVDVGTGTGLLAFAALRLWPAAYVTASDIDPVSVEVTAENGALNKVPIGTRRGAACLFVAAGVDNPGLVARGPFDLVVANILAGPLIALAPSLASVMAEGGTLVLAGLLKGQAEAVMAAYRAQGLRLADRIEQGEWPTLRLRMRRRPGQTRPRRWHKHDNGEAPGFGSW